MNSDKIRVQNDNIYKSLIAKNIMFDRIIIDDNETEERKIELLTDENNQLKEIVKQNKPQPQPKKEKQPVVQQKVEKDDEYNSEEEKLIEKKVQYNTITNLEEMKRQFFTNELSKFREEISKHKLTFAKGKYKYNSDKNGAPEFVATNLVRGFINQLDDSVRKYFMICFRCYKNGENYEYESFWILNTTDDPKNIVGDLYDDFEFTLILENDINDFLTDLEKKITEDNYPMINDKKLIKELYFH
jgi:hypothetical protein